jgi:hypothetical protein
MARDAPWTIENDGRAVDAPPGRLWRERAASAASAAMSSEHLREEQESFDHLR